MIADIESNKKLKPIATKLFLRGRKLNLSLVIISQSSCYYLTISRWPKLRLIATRYFIIKIPNKRELQQIASNHSSDIDFKDCMKLYNDYTKEPYSFLVMMMMMMMMMMINCFCGMVDRRKVFSLTSSQDHCQRSSLFWIYDTPQADFKPAQNLSSGLVEWSCAVVITTTARCHIITYSITI